MEIKVISDQLDFDFESRVGPINDGTFRCINPLSALVEKRAVRKGKNLKSKRRRREEKKEEIRERVETARPGEAISHSDPAISSVHARKE
jgi:hypothetical protein